ncbi:MAG: hypothetical protein HQL14_06755 [Candidatus Omnitrophica bacterium]|nr:hypothetical protein [Candidatus Omnitrophota bacterium]
MGETRLFISNFEIKEGRRIFLMILAFAPVLLLVGAVNICVDPAGLYKGVIHQYEGLEEQNAQSLIEGRNIENVRIDMDDRLLQKHFIQKMTSRADIVILGSSHSMWFGENIFPGKKVVNNSVIHVLLADYLGIFNGYAKKNLFPKRVIILLDPQLIAVPFVSERWLSIKEDTFGMLGRLKIRSTRIKQPLISGAWFNVFSFSYFQKSIEKLLRSSPQQIDPDHKEGRIGQLLFKDGRRLWTMKLLSWDIEKSRRKTIMELQDGTFMQEFNQRKMDKELESILENFIQYLINQHIQVTLCMLPIHPQVYKSFIGQENRPEVLRITDVEHYYQSLAQRFNLEIFGSYDPSVCHLGDRDFYDGDHIRNDVIEKMLKNKGAPCSMPGI